MDYSSLKTEGVNPKTANIDKASSLEIAKLINEQDKTVADAVEKALPQVAEGIDCLTNVLKNGGRIFYVGQVRRADSECLTLRNALPPTA